MIKLVGVDRHFQVGDQLVRALDGIDLTIQNGEYVSIMGPSGSGKSTLLNMLGLLDRPTAGHYYLDDKDTSLLSEMELATTRGEQIGFVFQVFHLVPRLTAEENVELPMVLGGLKPALRRKRVARALADMGLSDRAHHRPDQLSGGQRQRVAIARATVMEPSVLLADEPTGNLDSTSGLDVIEVLESLNAKGLSLLVVTHDPEVGSRAARRIKMMDGRIVADDGVAQ